MNFRFVYIILIISIIMSAPTFSQQDSTKKSAEEIINIKELVDQQIREIQEAEAAKAKAVKENNLNETASKNVAIKPETNKSNLQQAEKDIIIIDQVEEKSEITASTIFTSIITFFENSIVSKISIAFVTLLTMLLIYFWYKKQLKVQKSEISVLKQNIRKMREEKIGGLLDNNLSKVRSKLALKPIRIDGRSITAQAKKLSISKGEIHLAAKINLMMRQS